MTSSSLPLRRFADGSAKQPFVHWQFVAMSLPFLCLFIWFLYDAHLRPLSECYATNEAEISDEERSKACSELIPLIQFLSVFLVAEFVWMLLALYLSFNIPRRHSLIEAYLTQGQTVIGDIVYEDMMLFPTCLSSYGHVVYSLRDSSVVRREVRIFECYTRERTSILVLPGMPHSGQPKLDLEIDWQVIGMNPNRLKFLTVYSWIWTAFSVMAPVYIVVILHMIQSRHEEGNENVWQPDLETGNFIAVFFILAFAILPMIACMWTLTAWLTYKHWMTRQYKAVDGDGQVSNVRGRSKDDNFESVTSTKYSPPKVEVATNGNGAVPA